MKYDPWPTKEETSLAIKDKESTLEEAEEDPEERVMCKSSGEEIPIKKGDEAPLSTRVKHRKTGNRNAYLAGFK
jgi:hypothetical protein